MDCSHSAEQFNSGQLKMSNIYSSEFLFDQVVILIFFCSSLHLQTQLTNVKQSSGILWFPFHNVSFSNTTISIVAGTLVLS